MRRHGPRTTKRSSRRGARAPSPIRTAYLGTSDFAATVLRSLAESAHRPALVVTPPDRPRGRGRKLASPPAAEVARELGIDLLQSASVNDTDAVERILIVAPEAVAVCAFGQLIKEPLLSGYPMLNVHPSLLPRWRGAAPIERAIMAGDSEIGVTVMRVTEGLDSGPIALQEKIAITPDDDFASLAPKLAELGGELLVAGLDRLAAGELELDEQDDELATYAEKIEGSERRLDPARTAPELERVVRAIGPQIGTHLELEGGESLGVRKATAIEAGPGQGELVATPDLVLGCAEGALQLEIVQAPGKRPMSAGEFLRGHTPPSRTA